MSGSSCPPARAHLCAGGGAAADAVKDHGNTGDFHVSRNEGQRRAPLAVGEAAPVVALVAFLERLQHAGTHAQLAAEVARGLALRVGMRQRRAGAGEQAADSPQARDQRRAAADIADDRAGKCGRAAEVRPRETLPQPDVVACRIARLLHGEAVAAKVAQQPGPERVLAQRLRCVPGKPRRQQRRAQPVLARPPVRKIGGQRKGAEDFGEADWPARPHAQVRHRFSRGPPAQASAPARSSPRRSASGTGRL